MFIIRVLSLFDGISCGMVALERAGIPVEEYHAFEIDNYAIKVSEKNYPSIIHHGDVFNGDFTQFKGFDLLIGGSPCTFWSAAKRNREITPDGEGGQLFMQYVRALKESECKYFLYENNFSIHKDIKAFISEQLGVEPIVINSSLLSAQSRKRCYWTNIPNAIIQPEDKRILLKDVLEEGVGLNTVSNGKARTIKAQYNNTTMANIARKAGFGATGVAISVDENYISDSNTRIYSIHNQQIKLVAGTTKANLEKYTLNLPDGNYIIRKLTPIEVERLQTLPDNYTAGIPDAERYKCVGNGWTVDVVAWILRNLKNINT